MINDEKLEAHLIKHLKLYQSISAPIIRIIAFIIVALFMYIFHLLLIFVIHVIGIYAASARFSLLAFLFFISAYFLPIGLTGYIKNNIPKSLVLRAFFDLHRI